MGPEGRLRICVIFNFREGWLGGITYIFNLVNSLKFLPEKDRPEVIVLYNPDLAKFISDFTYPYLKAIPWKFPGVVRGFFASWLTGRNVFVREIIDKYSPDGIYPLNDWPISKRNLDHGRVKTVAWIPDLQHKFYPRYFKRIRRYLREMRIQLLLRHADQLVVSSHDVESHFRKFYSIRKGLRIHVLRFVSIMDDFSFAGLRDLQSRYNVPDKYFLVSNQFTNHKNHMVVLRALIRLMADRSPVHIVFTGKMEFKGNERYIDEIRTMIVENGLEGIIHMLGVIPRKDQLALMKHARAVLQPSLFEGWSTVIEDAKTLQVPVLAANLPVNIEQLGHEGLYFDPHDDSGLAELLSNFDDARKVCFESYEHRVENFARNFVSIFD